MPSMRQTIMIAVNSALNNIVTAKGYVSSVKTVSENLVPYSNMGESNTPALYPIDTNEVKEEWTFPRTATATDMKATLTVLITSYLFTRGGVTASSRCDLLKDIEKAMVNSTAMTLVTNLIDIRPMRVVTDQGTIENYSIHDQEFELDYVYNHADGG